MGVISLVLALLIISMPAGYSSDALFSKIDVPKVSVEKDSERVSSEGLTRYVYGAGLVASVKDSEINYYHSDRIQSNRLVTDSSGVGAVEREFKSLPFGQEISNSGVKYAFATGKELDESELYYFGARYYDSNLGRFTSVDPVKENEPYSYVRNNPMNMIDPSGMDEMSWVDEDVFNSVDENYGSIISEVGSQLSLTDGQIAGIFGSIYSEQLRRDSGGIKETSKKYLRSVMGFMGFEDDLKRTNKYGAGPGHIHRDAALDVWNYYSSHKDMFPKDYIDKPSKSLENIDSAEQNIKYMGILFIKFVRDWNTIGADISNRPGVLSTFYNQGYGSKGISERELIPGGVDIQGVGFGVHSANAGRQFNDNVFFETNIVEPFLLSVMFE